MSDQTNVSWSLSALILAAVGLLTIIVFIAWYFGSGEYTKGNTSSVKDIINNEVDMEPTVKTLTVTGNTTLGTDAADTVNIKADIKSDLVPDSTGQSLGSSTKEWGTVYVDTVDLGDGTMTQASDDNVRLTGAGFGFQRPIHPIDLGSGSGVTLGTSTSGYTYTLNNGTSTTSYIFTLPTATGSGTFYDFIFSQDFETQSSGGGISWLSPSSSDSFTGSIAVTSEPGGIGTSSVVFTGGDGNVAVGITYQRPVDEDFGGSYAVLDGSTFRVTDYGSNQWVVDGNLFVEGGVSGGNMVSPFA